MNRENEHSEPVVIPLLVGVLLLLAFAKLPKMDPWIEWSRLAFLVFGTASFFGAGWGIISNITDEVLNKAARARWHWFEPVIRLTDNTLKMNEDQIKYAREIGVVHEVFKVMPVGYNRYISTPWGTLSWDWIGDHMERCFKTWPIFPTIGQYSEGSIEYKNNYAFERWMVLWGLASERPGQEYIWRVTKQEAMNKVFELEEQELSEEST